MRETSEYILYPVKCAALRPLCSLYALFLYGKALSVLVPDIRQGRGIVSARLSVDAMVQRDLVND